MQAISILLLQRSTGVSPPLGMEQETDFRGGAMNETEYHRYIRAFNLRDYPALETFFADDFALENAGFIVKGKPAFRAFYKFFHEYCRETVRLKQYFPGKDSFVANLIISFEGLKELSPALLAERGYSGMHPVPAGVQVDVEFLILYELNQQGLIQHIKGAVWFPAPKT